MWYKSTKQPKAVGWGVWICNFYVQLDDGWPESVEEQGLLLLVWRRNFRNDIWKMCYRQSRRRVSRQNSEKCKTIVCIANTFTHRRFYTQKLLHTEAFTHRSFCTDAFTHKAFTHRSFYIQKLLHTEAFTHRRFYTDTFTHRHVYTQTLLHTDPFTHRSCFYTQTLVHTEAFTHRRFYTQALLHTNTFTHRRFYTQTVLHTSAFTHNHLYTQTLLHRGRPMYSQRSHRCRGHLSNPTGWCGEVLFPCDSKPASINMSWNQPQQGNVMLKCYPQTPQSKNLWIPM